MKKNKGFSKAGVIIGILVVALIAIASYFVIDGNRNLTNFDNYDFYSIIGPEEANGNIGDHVKGDAEAPALIFEYADYQCPWCATYNAQVEKVLEEMDGKLAVVFRTYPISSIHPNAMAAASAAEAAGLQGYWREYANKLFSEQAEWEYTSGSERTALFNQYFTEVSGGKGDLDKFNADIASKEVAKKISFDMGIAKRIDLGGTPEFYIDGQLIDLANKNGASLTIDGQTLSWDHSLNMNEFRELLKSITLIKNGEKAETTSWLKS